MKQLFILIISVFVLSDCEAETVNGIRISSSETHVNIENKLISLNYDLNTGTYAAFDKVRKTEAVYNASTHVDDFYSSDKGVISTYVVKAVDEKLGKGAALIITSKKYNYPDQLFEITLFNNKGFITLKSGIKNTLKQSYKVVKFSPVAGASIFKGADLKENFRLLDGEGGGAETFIRKEPFFAIAK